MPGTNEFHKNLVGDNIHVPHAWEYADQTAREGASGFVTADLNKIALQLDDYTLYALTATTPTWTSYGSGHSHSNKSTLDLIDQDVSDGSSPTLDGTNITGIISGETDQIHLPCRKSTAGTIPKDKPVYLAGHNTNYYLVEEADASDPAKMPAIGLTEEAITDSATGFAVYSGRYEGVDTSTGTIPGSAINKALYVAPGGGLTTTKPIGPHAIQVIARISKVDAVGTLAVMGAGRTNAVPNIAEDKVWLGDSNGVAQETDLDTKISANVDVTGNTSDRHTHSNKTELDLVSDGDHDVRSDNPHGVDIDDVTPSTTKGDILVENGSNVIRVAIGTNDQVLTADSAQASGIKWADSQGGGGGLGIELSFYPDQMDNPNNSDWVINALARATRDTNNPGLTVRAFDDTLEEGVGIEFEIPADATNIRFFFRSRAETAAVSNLDVIPKVYFREQPHDVSVESWSSGYNLDALTMGNNNETFQYASQTIAISNLGLIAGRMLQMELTRNTGSGSDTLIDDWVLKLLKVSFS